MAKKTSPRGAVVRKTAGKQNTKKINPRPAAEIKRQMKIQQALYEIADAASAARTMQEFYAGIHTIISELMVAKSFYIGLYDEATDLLAIAYWKDAAGDEPAPDAPLQKIIKEKRLTGLMMQSRKTLHLNRAKIIRLTKSGQADTPGTLAEDWVSVPLQTREQLLGCLTLQSYEAGVEYTEQDVKVLEYVAQHIATALTRARAIEETRQRNSELQIINSIQQGLAAELDFQSIVDLVGDKLRVVFDTPNFEIRWYDEKTNLLHFLYTYEHGKRVFFSPVHPPPGGVFDTLQKTRKPYVLNSIAEIEKLKAFQLPGSDTSTKSVIWIPIISSDRVRGLIGTQNFERENAFGESEIRLLTTIAASLGTALENARLFNETQRLLKETEQRNAELAILNSVQEGLASKLEMQEIYDLVGDKIREIFKEQAQTVFFAFYDPSTDLADFPYLYQKGELRRIKDWKPDNLLARKQIEIRETIFIKCVADLEPFGMASDYAQSAVFVPLMIGMEIRGVVGVLNHEREYVFIESDVHLLEILANSMSVALENARLWEQEKIFRKALQRELEIGREIQAGFLPEALPVVDGWEIAASLMSAREVAGDFYDVFDLPDGNIGLVIADVCDKGVGAALFMTLFRSLIRAAANLEYFEHTQEENTPQSVTQRLQRAVSLTNNYIAETHGQSGMFATLFFGILDPRDGKLTYINGGHEPPLIIQSGNTRESLRKTGPAVGAIPNCGFEILETQLDAGETFFAFTDGVPDCKDPHGEFFGRERLLDVFQRASDSSLNLVKTVESELRQYISNATQFDDITLLAVRRG